MIASDKEQIRLCSSFESQTRRQNVAELAGRPSNPQCLRYVNKRGAMFAEN